MITQKKIKAFLGHLILLLLIFIGAIQVFIFFYALFTLNLYLFGYLILVIVIGPLSSKNTYFIRFIKWFQIENLLKEVQIIQEEPLQDKNSLFCFHPHGVFANGIMLNINRKGTFMENIVGLGSRASIFFPLLGMLIKWWGIQGVDANNLKSLLAKGINCAMYPGGFEEATLTSNHENRVFLKQRKGFIKYALQYGTSIYPVFVFGENQIYECIDTFQTFRLFLNKFKMFGTIFYSKYITLPNPNTELITIVGKKIQLPKIKNPSKDEIDKYHQIYIKELENLYNKYQPLYAPNIKLKIH